MAPAASPAPDSDDLPDAPSIFREMARIRQLPQQAQPPVEFLRRAQYLAAARTPSSARSTGALELQDELGLVPSGSDLRFEELRLLSSDGFYDHRDHTVYVLDDPARRFPFAEERVLAHECIHALQDQNGLFSVRFPRSTDGMLAQQALIEGDATLAELLYEERNWHTPIRRVADRVMRGFAMEPISRQIFVRNPALANASAVSKGGFAFPLPGWGGFRRRAAERWRLRARRQGVCCPSRFHGADPTTNPEELLGAAHAACFAMTVAFVLTEAGHAPKQLKVAAAVEISKVGAGFSITSIALDLEARVEGLGSDQFRVFAEAAKTNCPVSKALSGTPISLSARLA